MFIRQTMRFLIPQPKILIHTALRYSKTHTKTCPTAKTRRVCPGAGGSKGKGTSGKIKRGPVCPKITKGSGSDDQKETGLKRAQKPGKCRMGFIPEEWFRFFGPMTGVTGPYMFMLGLGNYIASKEILVMEHEYYLGLSVGLVLYFVTTRLGPMIGATLDKQVDAVASELDKGRNDEIAAYKKQIKDAETAIWRAQGQKDLIDAKKENVAVQLEAIYRERLAMVYKNVRNRMEYHVRRHRIQNRVKRKWMEQWILENVIKSITPEFKKRAMEIAIKDLEDIANSLRK